MRPQVFFNIGQTNISKTQFWKVQSRPDCNSRVKKLEQAQNHGDWCAAHRAAAAFFLMRATSASVFWVTRWR